MPPPWIDCRASLQMFSLCIKVYISYCEFNSVAKISAHAVYIEQPWVEQSKTPNDSCKLKHVLYIYSIYVNPVIVKHLQTHNVHVLGYILQISCWSIVGYLCQYSNSAADSLSGQTAFLQPFTTINLHCICFTGSIIIE